MASLALIYWLILRWRGERCVPAIIYLDGHLVASLYNILAFYIILYTQLGYNGSNR